MPAWQVPRNLAVDNDVLVPVNKVVHVLVTSSDVIHSWTIPSFGSKVDAVPGRVTATWFKAEKEGIYFGQCSELCGKDHAFMPIAVRVVKEQTFNDWAAALKARDKKKAKEIIRSVAVDLPDQTKTSPTAGRCDSCRAAPARAGPTGCQSARVRIRRQATWQARLTRITVTATTTPTRPTASGAGSIRPTTKTSARCTCCSPSWAG